MTFEPAPWLMPSNMNCYKKIPKLTLFKRPTQRGATINYPNALLNGLIDLLKIMNKDNEL